MKLLGIFRGFPGLGRVVSGVELITYFRDHNNADIKLFSYLQGEEYLTQKGYTVNYTVSGHDYSSIGIIPVSAYGEFIFNQIEEFVPDIVIIDGEPLMLQSLRIVYPTLKIVALLNPFDVENPSNQHSSRLFFNTLFSLADLVIVHGFWKLDAPKNFNNFHSINTIIRKEVLAITPTISKNKISCILGGGTVNSKSEFQVRSIAIANKCIQMAEYFTDYEIHIFCSCEEINSKLSNKTVPDNIIIHSNIKSSEHYYGDSRLIIARAGRNTISELLYLGIPAIVIPTGCKFRSIEQKTNAEIIDKISHSRITNVDENINTSDLVNLMRKMLNSYNQNIVHWNPGNMQAIDLILNLYNSK